MSPEIRDHDLPYRPAGLPELPVPNLLCLKPGTVSDIPGIVVYEPKEKVGLWPNLEPECFLLAKGEGWRYRISPSSEDTLGSVFYKGGGLIISVMNRGGGFTVLKERARGHQGFGRIWVLSDNSLILHRAENARRAALLRTNDSLVVIPKLIGWPGVILTTDNEIRRPENLEILMNILNT